MKVFATIAFWPYGEQKRAVVAANSATAAGRVFGIRGQGVRHWVEETRNPAEVEAAMQEPGAIFVRPIRGGSFQKFVEVPA